MITIHFDVIIFLIWPARKIMLEMVVYESPAPSCNHSYAWFACPAPRPPDRKMDIGHCALLVCWK